MRELDGADAGGQFVRTALSLAALENEPIRIENVRGDRSTPGMRPQHLAVLETMEAICDAEVSGAAVGSETIEFEPRLESDGEKATIPGGSYAVGIATAGSITLLFDAVLPLATALEEPLSLTVTGGTDVTWSPPIEYATHVKFPVLRRFGLEVCCDVDRRGFYPDGGGRATLHLAPSNIEPIDLEMRGSVDGVRCYSTESASLANSDVAARQATGALERLSTRCDDAGGLEVRTRRETTAASDCPGSAVVLRLEHAGGLAGFSSLGERGKPAERVGEDAADAANRFLESGAAVDRHLADQLLVFLALAGGAVRTSAVTDHVAASLGLLDEFRYEFDRERADDSVLVRRA
ncbi:ribosomal subunit interface protein [Halostagnicola larsenii XH-48]|uniref:RNA 3'-terminal phosphate cyclase n=1 Tax=Halostagnicola larsenii XH-48 TaxID=797299 RepID=W0JNJ8_9EURY|nr:RNA 3'-terminal phosphate cyclase [Halostagnicola larsenii]AHG00179.1 ribosomal subunit interface protein [Halostagnicola larsenii XH-48]